MRLSKPYKTLGVLIIGVLVSNIGYQGTPISRNPNGWVHFYYWMLAGFAILALVELLTEDEPIL